MPTKTFQRLNQKKRTRFIHEAYKEFSLNTYQGASITNLVKTLGIAKGSVYQYFEDKEELYRHLVEETIHQLNLLLDKTCPYEGDNFYNWYNKFLLVQLRYYLSFPAQAVILRHVQSGTLGIDRKLKHEITQVLRSRINHAYPEDLHHESMVLQHLIYSPLLLFDLLTFKLNLAKIISAGDSIFLDNKELMQVCQEWTQKLKSGL